MQYTNYCCDPGISAHVVHNPTAEYFGVNLIGRIVGEKGVTPCFLMGDISEFHDSLEVSFEKSNLEKKRFYEVW